MRKFNTATMVRKVDHGEIQILHETVSGDTVEIIDLITQKKERVSVEGYQQHVKKNYKKVMKQIEK